MLLSSQLSGVYTEFILSDWFLLVECVYKKLAIIKGKQISVTGHNVGALVYSVSIEYPNSVGVIVSRFANNGQFKLLQGCNYDKLRFDRHYGVVPPVSLLEEFARVGLHLLTIEDNNRTSKGLPV